MHEVSCRVCKQRMDIDAMSKDEWIMPSRNFYYHTKCYNDWKKNTNHNDNDWIDLIYDFIARDLKGEYDYFMCEAQRKKFINQNRYTNKGIYFTLKYFYEIKKGDWSKGNGGIGIIPYMYKEATEYWTQKELKRQGTLNEIEEQIRERAARPVQKIKRDTKPKKDKTRWSLDDI